MKNTKVIICFIVAILIVGGGAFFLGKQFGNKGSEGASSTAQATDKVASDSSESMKEGAEGSASYDVAYTISNSWDSGDLKATQIDGKIYNYTDSATKDWTLTITVEEGSKIESGWNGNYDIKGSTLTITSMDYNKEIQAGQSIDFGFIIDCSKEFSPEETVLDVQADSGSASVKVSGLGGQKTGEVTEGSSTSSSSDSSSGNSSKSSDTSASAGNSTGGNSVVPDGANPVRQHGRLSVKGTSLVDKKGRKYRLKGVSTHGIAWFPEYVNKSAFKSLKKRYKVNTIRLAMYSATDAGYTKSLHAKVKEGVKYATELGMYVIIDWHILSDGNPNTADNIRRAKAFFKEMSRAYKKQSNVIYEICNEPNGNVTWDNDIKPYANKMIKVIRKNDKKAVIIVGTPTWSQDVDVVSNSPLKGYKNIMYALHFYAATHKDDLRNKAQTALNNGLPIFISEYSICDASGNGSLDKASASEWFKFIKKNNLSCVAWSLCNKDEAASLLKPSCTKTGGFKNSDLSTTGKWILSRYRKM